LSIGLAPLFAPLDVGLSDWLGDLENGVSISRVERKNSAGQALENDRPLSRSLRRQDLDTLLLPASAFRARGLKSRFVLGRSDMRANRHSVPERCSRTPDADLFYSPVPCCRPFAVGSSRGENPPTLDRCSAFEPKSLSRRQMMAKPADFPQASHSPFGLSVVEDSLTMV
jgi:hypothetical protein